MANQLAWIKWAMTLGRAPQSFLGARWLRWMLRAAPQKSKPLWALRILSLSPHYFYLDEKAWAGKSRDSYLRETFEENLAVRKRLCDALIKPYMTPDALVLDYGCGPGYFAVAAAKHAKKVFACDISEGALACARVLNSAPNIEYITADEKGLSVIADGAVDVAYSFAVVQHVTDEVFGIILGNCARKLKSGGKLILHVVCDDPAWKSESEWRSDRTIKGRIRFQYGLNCFTRKESELPAFVARYGFKNTQIRKVAELVSGEFDDICRQHLLMAEKA